MRPIKVTSHDGLSIAAYEAGRADGPEILFIHGVFQCHLAWRAQLADAALESEFRMVAFDLRGHGNSDKPVEKARYSNDRCWADDIAAVIAEARLKRPVLVGWSYGGRVITDYLRHRGQGNVAGLNFVAAVTRTDPAAFGAQRVHLGKMHSEDLLTQIAATRGFVRGCFERQPSQEDYETILAYNMMVPVTVRGLITDRSHNPGDVMESLRVPVLLTHGERDEIVLPRMSHWAASAIAGATLSLYPGVGHSPFAEDAPRFNRELAEFVRGANGVTR